MSISEILLTFRQNIITTFKKYEYIMLPLLKFMAIFIVTRTVMLHLGYVGALNDIFFILLFSLVGTFLPAKWLDLAMVIFMPLCLFKINPILAGLSFFFFLIVYLLYMRLYPKEGLLIIITIAAFSYKLEIVVPFIAALFGSYICVISILIGVMIWYIMPALGGAMQPGELAKEEIMNTVNNIISTDFTTFLKNETMLSVMIIFFIIFSLIYIIRKQKIDYAPYIAIGIGATMSVVGFGMSILFLEGNQVGFIHVILTSIVAVIVAVIAQFFSIILDYQRAEQVTFEDEENFYYVHVVPKIHFNANAKKVKRVYNGAADTHMKTKAYTHDHHDDDDLPFPPGLFE